MITIVSQISADPIRRLVQVALTIYLMPVVAIVCIIGGASIVFDRLSRFSEPSASDAAH